MGIQKARTLPYHHQTNGQVEQVHQTLMQMIVKLGRDQKAEWSKHLPELVHAYNSTGQPSLHTAHTTWCLCNVYAYPSIFIFPLLCVNHCIADLCEQLCKTFKEVQAQSTSEAERQRQYYDHKANAISLEPGNLVLAKADTYKGRRKVKDQWEE